MKNRIVQLSRDLDFLRPLAVPDLWRLGRDQDGGYITGDRVVQASSALLSLGVGDDWSFDQQWHQLRPQDTIHAYDGSIDWSQISPQQAQSYHEFWRHPVTHFPVNIGLERGNNIVSFDRAMEAINTTGVFVKMDIEGGEWELLPRLCEWSADITGVVVEFHDVGRLRDWFRDRVSQLLEYFDLIHVHGNNTCWMCDDALPSVIELSFARQGFYTGIPQRRSQLYLPDLDRPNLATESDIEMIFVDS